MLRGFRPHPTAVPQGMPERDPFGANNPFARPGDPYLDGPGGRRNREDPNAMVPDDNKTIRELTEVFKPLPTSEYLKAQTALTK